MLFLNTHRSLPVLLILLLAVSLLLAACEAVIPTPTSTPTPADTATPTASPTPEPTATPTSLPPLAVLLAAPGADPAQISTYQTALSEIVSAAGLRWQVRQRLEAADLGPELRLIVALPPDPGLAALAAAAPQAQFLAVGIPGLAASANLSIVGAQGPRPDQQGFIAGVVAAMLTPDWRVGVISIADTVEGRSARSGFINGVIYFCGLCRQAYPPFYDYPLYVELPATASSAEWQAAANFMIDHLVQTVYISPGINDPAMLDLLVQANVTLLGSGVPSETLRPRWAASLASDPLGQVQSVLPQLLQGQGGQDLPLPLGFAEVNPDLFSPGKQRLAEQMLTDLLAGYIDTGVDLATGENK
jgi:hypothetical protein